MTKSDKVKYLKEYYYRCLLMSNETKPVIVDGIEYIVRDDKLVITNIHEMDKEFRVVIDNAYAEIDIESLSKKVKEHMQYLDLSSVSKVNENAFVSCYSLREVKGNKLKTITRNCFRVCRSLKKATFSDLRIVGEYAFTDTNLTDFYAPHLYKIGIDAFKRTGIKSFKFEREPELHGFNGMPALTEVEIPCPTYLTDYLLFSEISILRLTNFRDTKNYYKQCRYRSLEDYYGKICGMTDKALIEKYIAATKKMAERFYKPKEGVYYQHTFVDKMPNKLRHLYIDMSGLNDEEKQFYDMQFMILRAWGILIHKLGV